MPEDDKHDSYSRYTYFNMYLFVLIKAKLQKQHCNTMHFNGKSLTESTLKSFRNIDVHDKTTGRCSFPSDQEVNLTSSLPLP